MKTINYDEIVSKEKIQNAVKNDEFIGFIEDYSVIHCLLSEWKPKKIFEIGTNVGNGCRVIRGATPSTQIITLDIRKGAGALCPPDVEKVIGDSLSYDYSKHYPIDCWFIDGEHTYHNVYTETNKALESYPKYIIYHDADIEEVYQGIQDAFLNNQEGKNYELFQVISPPFVYSSSGKNVTRIAYAIRNN